MDDQLHIDLLEKTLHSFEPHLDLIGCVVDDGQEVPVAKIPAFADALLVPSMDAITAAMDSLAQLPWTIPLAYSVGPVLLTWLNAQEPLAYAADFARRENDPAVFSKALRRYGANLDGMARDVTKALAKVQTEREALQPPGRVCGPRLHETSPILKDLHIAILQVLDKASPRGLLQHQIADKVIRSRTSVWPYLHDLYLWSLARRDSPRGPSVITSAGRDALEMLKNQARRNSGAD
jgi:hypothetical protein